MHTTPAPAPKPEAEPEPDLTPDAAMVHIKAVRRVKRIEAELTMLIAQTKALETLMHCMTPVQSTGDTRRDAAHARERNRQRLAATQTLLHIRTVQREQRLRRTMSDKAKAKAERWQPSAASDAVQEQKRKAPSPPAERSSRPPPGLRSEAANTTPSSRSRAADAPVRCPLPAAQTPACGEDGKATVGQAGPGRPATAATTLLTTLSH